MGDAVGELVGFAVGVVVATVPMVTSAKVLLLMAFTVIGKGAPAYDPPALSFAIRVDSA